MTEESKRLREGEGPVLPWRKWGPYVSERSWGTVREDYSSDGDAWKYFTHEQSRSKAFRWGEDAIAGICDRYQVLNFAFAFWNGKDRILKERLFGLGSAEGNHGEDVKEYYFHLDNTPSHAYMKYLYKYPMAAYPYEDLVAKNAERQMKDREYELIDTGIFEEQKYFDLVIEYAKASPDDICIRLEIFNRSDEEASIHILPHLWFRNTWGWGEERKTEPKIEVGPVQKGCQTLVADDSELEPLPRLNIVYRLGKIYLYGDEGGEPLFTNNESHEEVLGGGKSATPYVKDAFHRHVIGGEDAVNPEKIGTKATIHYKEIKVPAKGSHVIKLRMTNTAMSNPLGDLDKIVEKRKSEADTFYENIHPKKATEDEKRIQRQALSGMLWNKQIYLYDVNDWLRGDNPNKPPPEGREGLRNYHWRHLISKRVLSMPDKWEYPWFAAWDLAFHTVSLGLVDIRFAKEQLWHLLFDQFQHPNGQIPAYEWEFSELNPPVQAWAAMRLYEMEYEQTGKRDLSFLKKCFHKLILNFVWWVNKVDSKGNNVFEGGFLGLDNITIFDRSAEIPGGGKLEQSDGTGWMGTFCLLLMRMSLELSRDDPVYEAMATKFFEHFIYIGNALEHAENRDVQLWDDEDGFFYDVVAYPDKTNQRIEVRSLVGIIPLYAIDCLSAEELERCKEFSESFRWFIKYRTELTANCVTAIESDGKTKYLLSLMNLGQMQRVLECVWNPGEFRSLYGVRSLSKYYEKNPYELLGHRISYEPGEAEVILKGGNSNWRGPIWFPTNFMLIESLKKLDVIVGDGLKVSFGDQKPVNSKEMARYFASALISLFRRNEEGKRPVYADCEMFQNDPHWRDLILFYEHYHGDNGRGLGASHQTGWSGLVANLIHEWL